jgi:uncharacterized membrane protein
MEKKYRVIHYSKIRFACILIPSWLSGFPLAMLLLPFGILGQIILGILAIVLVFTSFFIIPKYIAKAILVISIDSEGFQLDWVKPYWGSKPKQTQHVRLDELKSYKYESSYNFSTLKLRLKSGSILQLHRWYNDSDDDFDKFMTHFKRTIESYNKKKSTTTVIEKEKSIMENRTFLIAIGLLLGVIFVATILLFIFKGVSNLKGIIPILIVLGPLIWVVIRIVKGLQKTKIE